jgi:hypothetical protein
VDADEDHHIKVVAVGQHQRQESQNQPENTDLKPFVLQQPSQFFTPPLKGTSNSSFHIWHLVLKVIETARSLLTFDKLRSGKAAPTEEVLSSVLCQLPAANCASRCLSPLALCLVIIRTSYPASAPAGHWVEGRASKGARKMLWHP